MAMIAAKNTILSYPAPSQIPVIWYMALNIPDWFKSPVSPTSLLMSPSFTSACEMIPISLNELELLTSMMVSEVITTVDMNLGRYVSTWYTLLAISLLTSLKKRASTMGIGKPKHSP